MEKAKSLLFRGIIVALGLALLASPAFANDEGTPGPQFGDGTGDFVFVPVTPCRIIDTRFAVSPSQQRFTPGAIQTYAVSGNVNDYSSQGGFAGDCFPAGQLGDVYAIMATVTATDAAGNGNLRAFAYSGPLPLVSNLNYQAGVNLANTTIIPVCNNCGNNLDIDIFSSNAVDVVVDLVGYFDVPVPTELDCVSVASAGLLVATGNNYSITQACPAGYTVTGSDVFHSGVGIGFWHWENEMQDATNDVNCRGYNDTGSNATVYCRARCCRIPGLSN